MAEKKNHEAKETEKPEREKALAGAESMPMTAKISPQVSERGLELRSMDEMWRFAVAVSKSGLAPKGVETPEAILVAMQMGLEIGLTPMAAMQNIAVINGRPSIWGDAQLAICRGSAAWDEAAFSEIWEGTPYQDGFRAIAKCGRRGGPQVIREFSVADAKAAGLWGKQGPWQQYPRRMLQCRARSWALRDTFSDVLKGLRAVEEVRDDFLREAEGQVIPAEANRAEMLAQRIVGADHPNALYIGPAQDGAKTGAGAFLPPPIQKEDLAAALSCLLEDAPLKADILRPRVEEAARLLTKDQLGTTLRSIQAASLDEVLKAQPAYMKRFLAEALAEAKED